MPDLGNALTKQAGPLPVFGWVVLVGGGLAYVVYQNRKKGPTISTGTDTATGETQAPLQTTGSGTLVPANVTVVPNTPTTNAEWVSAAIEAMQTAQPFLDVAAATDALNAYISGSALTPAQAAYVALARALVGPPPIALPTHSGGTPGPLPGPPPAKTYHYAVEHHQFAQRILKRQAVIRFSDPSVALPTRVEVALRATNDDPANKKYAGGATFPPQSSVMLHVVKKGPGVTH